MLRDTETAETGERATDRDAVAAVGATPPAITEGVSGIRFEIGPDGTGTAEQPGSRTDAGGLEALSVERDAAAGKGSTPNATSGDPIGARNGGSNPQAIVADPVHAGAQVETAGSEGAVAKTVAKAGMPGPGVALDMPSAGEPEPGAQSTPTQATQQPAADTARPPDMAPMLVEAKPAHVANPTATPQVQNPAQAAQGPLDGVAVHIAKAAGEGFDRLRIELHPASLGGIDVTLEIGRDGRVEAVIRADRPETLDLLQRDARQLARAFQDAGLQADSGSFDFRQRDGGGQSSASSANGTAGPRAGAEDPVAAMELLYRSARPSGVDLRV